MNSREFSSAQKMSSSANFLSVSLATMALNRADSRAVGFLHGPRPGRQARKLVLRLRHLADAVEKRLGLDAAKARPREVARVAGVAGVGLGVELIRPRQADVAHQLLEVVLVGGESSP